MTEDNTATAAPEADPSTPKATKKARFKSWWRGTALSDKIQLFAVVVGTLTVLVGTVALILVYLQLRENTETNNLVYLQLRENTKTNKVSTRGQLYASDFSLVNDEVTDEKQSLMTLWTVVPPNIRDQEFARGLVKLVSEDQTAQEAKTVEELYKSMFGFETFNNKKRREETIELRRVFLHIQNTFYHVHNAHDYWVDGILTDNEWLTWKGYIREMNAHPLLLAVIWNGSQHRYFSEAFGRFIQQELCADSVPPGDPNPEAYKRGKEFVSYFYPEMLSKEWADALPDY